MGYPDASASLKEKDWEKVDMDTKIVLDHVPQVDDNSPVQFRLYKKRFVGCIAMVTNTPTFVLATFIFVSVPS